jgi:hypothetical protein
MNLFHGMGASMLLTGLLVLGTPAVHAQTLVLVDVAEPDASPACWWAPGPSPHHETLRRAWGYVAESAESSLIEPQPTSLPEHRSSLHQACPLTEANARNLASLTDARWVAAGSLTLDAEWRAETGTWDCLVLGSLSLTPVSGASGTRLDWEDVASGVDGGSRDEACARAIAVLLRWVRDATRATGQAEPALAGWEDDEPSLTVLQTGAPGLATDFVRTRAALRDEVAGIDDLVESAAGNGWVRLRVRPVAGHTPMLLMQTVESWLTGTQSDRPGVHVQRQGLHVRFRSDMLSPAAP